MIDLEYRKRIFFIACIIYSLLVTYFNPNEKNDFYADTFKYEGTLHNMLLLLLFILLFIIALISITIYDYYYSTDSTKDTLEDILKELQKEEKQDDENKCNKVENSKSTDDEYSEDKNANIKNYISKLCRFFIFALITYLLNIFFSDLLVLFIILFIFIMYRNKYKKNF